MAVAAKIRLRQTEPGLQTGWHIFRSGGVVISGV
jgi:hypothetical protein